MGIVGRRAHRNKGFAADTKAGIQTAIGSQADDRKVIVATVVADPGYHQLAVGLLDDAECVVTGTAHGYSNFTAIAKT